MTPRHSTRFALGLLCVVTGAANAQARYTLSENLRVGGAEQGPELFQYAKAIEVDGRGNIFIYDRKTQDVRVFAPDGKYIKTFGRLGSGPGELRDAEGIAFAPDGKLWVRDAANSRFSLFKVDGTFEKSWNQFFCSSQGMWNPKFDRAGRVIDADCVVENGRGGRMALMAFHSGGPKVDTLGFVPDCGDRALSQAGTWITTRMRDGKMVGQSFRSIPWAAARLSTWTANGDIYCAPNTAKYEITKTSLGGKDTVRISRNAALVPVTAFEKDSVIKGIEAQGPTGLDFSRIPATKPAIDRMVIDDKGRLWVRHTNAKREIEFDVFGADGKLAFTANMGVIKSGIYEPFVVRGDNVYTVALDSDDVQHVVRFRLVKKD